jgi:hypothetical protein
MAKASIGHPAQAKVKAAAPAAAARKKAKMTAEPKRKAGGAGSAAPKPTPAPRKKVAVLGSSKTVAAKGKTATLKQDAAAKKAAPSKPAAAAKKTAAVKKPVAKTAAARTGAAAKTTSRTKSVAKPVAVKNTAPRRRAARTAVPIPAPRRGRPPATASRTTPTAASRTTPTAASRTTLAAASRTTPTAASRTTPATASRTTPTAPPGGRPGDSAPQVFTVSHLNEADFKADGLRAYARYRDLGIAAATGGLCQAHVIRLVPPCTDDVRKRHQHEADLQLVYVLQGWMKNEFEGHGVQMMSAGSCWLQPSGIKHTVLDYSADCEVLEIIVPADFKTEDAA